MMELHICNQAGVLLRAFALGDHPEVIVGRDESCDVRILSPTVSREHCSIEQREGRLVLRDLGSTSGTLHDGRPVDTVELRDGMQFSVGPALLRFHDTDD